MMGIQERVLGGVAVAVIQSNGDKQSVKLILARLRRNIPSPENPPGERGLRVRDERRIEKFCNTMEVYP
jgi:hypothetical protein